MENYINEFRNIGYTCIANRLEYLSSLVDPEDLGDPYHPEAPALPLQEYSVQAFLKFIKECDKMKDICRFPELTFTDLGDLDCLWCYDNNIEQYNPQRYLAIVFKKDVIDLDYLIEGKKKFIKNVNINEYMNDIKWCLKKLLKDCLVRD